MYILVKICEELESLRKKYKIGLNIDCLISDSYKQSTEYYIDDYKNRIIENNKHPNSIYLVDIGNDMVHLKHLLYCYHKFKPLH